ncbi:helix-loop-helix DNA-binding domain-containing protein [Triangularia verruculosa]|uniref:Helix-loop-helix DNA-binding domain-containing protein n=1 Tax=Triangularia verruculosa TaxID=2587418 RepID=A0AAN6XG49_9PEZI|nr:helix-loop-helix DNA-binding domain-containing protein [Triangularia verruculosa]
MSGLTIDSSTSFDTYANSSFDAAQLQSYSDFSPIFDNFEDFGTDFNSDSAASPISPISPVLSSSSFSYPAADQWVDWDRIEHSPEPDALFKTNPFDGSILPSNITNNYIRNPSLSPAINPMATVIGTEGIDSQAPLFQTPPIMVAPLPSQQPQMAASMDDASKRYPSRNLKRKTSIPSKDDEPLPAPKRSSSPPSATPRRSSKDNTAAGPKKTAHNMIEKRYRTNLNDKISQLRDAVPALRIVAQRMENPGAYEENSNDDRMAEELLGGLSPAAKLNKATILAKATEYIMQLERRNLGLETENNALRGRMEGLEMLLMSRGGPQAQQHQLPAWN